MKTHWRWSLKTTSTHRLFLPKRSKYWDFKTEVIAAGDKALARLKVDVPEIIVLDLHLPEVLGTSIIRTIRADERLSETLVIIATADPRSADLVQDMADLVLIKPTTFSQVRDLAGASDGVPPQSDVKPRETRKRPNSPDRGSKLPSN